MELIGEVINSAAGVSPATSLQFGYISRINGIDNVFAGAVQNETTAIYTFVTHATTTRRTVHGPLVILAREGTTTIYCNNAPKGDFANPDSFSAGTAIQFSTYRQQSVTNTVSNSFTTTHVNTVTSVENYTDSAGDVHRLGWAGQTWRTTLTGQLNTATPPLLLPTGSQARWPAFFHPLMFSRRDLNPRAHLSDPRGRGPDAANG